MNKTHVHLLLCLFVCVGSTDAIRIPGARPKRIRYKTVGGHDLYLNVFRPKQTSRNAVPAVVFFHAGGWRTGKPEQFYAQAKHYADKGMVGMSVEYRTRENYGGTKIPWDCVEDAKSAIRFVRKNSKRLGIDPNKIIAGGASAGGHIAAAAGTISGSNARTDDLSVSAVPNALILFCPVYDNSPRGYGYGIIGPRYKEISPMQNINRNMPPTIVFLGTKDEIIPVSTAKLFQKRMKSAGVRSDLKLYKGQRHGFFNYDKYYKQTTKQMDRFLEELGYL
jgi:acetyl esterase